MQIFFILISLIIERLIWGGLLTNSIKRRYVLKRYRMNCLNLEVGQRHQLSLFETPGRYLNNWEKTLL